MAENQNTYQLEFSRFALPWALGIMLLTMAADSASGATVCLRLGFYANEVHYYIDNPALYPVCTEKVDWLQITPEFLSDQELKQTNGCFRTDGWMEEYILTDSIGAYRSDPVNGNLGGLAKRIQRVENAGFTVKELIIYREPMISGLVPGPWSDTRLLARQDIDTIRQLFKNAFAKGIVKYDRYNVMCLVYQFANLNDAAKLFIKNNFFGLCLEVNSHDYASKNEDADAADGAKWGLANGLQFGITSGAGLRLDDGYKKMYAGIFAFMAMAGVEKTDSRIRYILHHNNMTLGQTMPENVANSVTENCAWIIGLVKPAVGITLAKPAMQAADPAEAVCNRLPHLRGFKPHEAPVPAVYTLAGKRVAASVTAKRAREGYSGFSISALANGVYLARAASKRN